MSSPDDIERRRYGGGEWQRTSVAWALALIATILTGWALHATAAVVVPVVFSLFLALLVAPVDTWAMKQAPGRARWVGHVVAMGVILAALLLLVGMIWLAAQQVMERFPLQGRAPGSLLPAFGQDGFLDRGPPPGQAAAQAQGQSGGGGLLSEALRTLGDRLAQWASRHATSVVAAAGTTMAAAVLVFFLTLIMLIEAPKWRKKTDALLDRSSREEQRDSLGVITRRLHRYLWVRTVLGVVTAVLYVAWLWIFGIDLLMVWGLLAFALNYIPTLGSLIAGILPIAYAFVQKDPGTAVGVGIGILVIEQVMGNYADPRLQGRQLSISSLVVLVALLFWGWLWGIAGAILAVPMTISILVICAHIDPLRPLALLLSDETDQAGLDRVVNDDD